MTKNFLFLALALSFSILFTACEKDDPVIPHEEELITTLKYTLSSNDGAIITSLVFKDLDGDGGDAPTISGGTLAANQTYIGTIQLLNEAESPIEDITVEVEEEGLDHQFFFQSTISNLTIDYNDQDQSGNPVGLSSILTTGAATSGTLTIILKHEPKKDASGVSDGDLSNAEGETDIEVTFPIDVQ